MARLLEGRSAVVTGAASGIGKAIVETFVQQGATVLAVDIAREALEVAFGDNESVHCIDSDVGDPGTPRVLHDFVTEAFSGLDILVNNAGIAGRLAPLFELSDEEWEKVLTTDLTSVFRITREFVPLLKKSSAARIINTGSVCSKYALPLVGAYTAAKHGVLGISKAFAVDLGEFNITVNCVLPGSTITGLTREFFPDANSEAGRAYLDEATVLGRYALPADIAGVALFLASDLGAYVTGQSIGVDGGMMCKMPPLPITA